MNFSPLSSRSTFLPSLRWGILSVIVLGVGIGVWLVVPAKNVNEAVKPDDKPKVEQAQVVELGAGDIATIEARELHVVLPISGTLSPLSQATVKSKVAAEVRQTLALEGARVKRGQIVVRLDPENLQAQLVAQQAAEEDAQAKLSLAKKNSANSQTLLKQNFISQNAFDAAQNSVELAQAGVKSAASQGDIARRALADAEVRAPIDGIISKRFVQPGEKVALDMPLFSLVDLTQMVLEAPIPANDIPRIRVGQDVSFNVDGFQGQGFSGKVARINPVAESGSRVMLVYISVANKDGALRGGMFAKGSIAIDKSAVAPLVPIAALHRENGIDVVYKIEENRIVVQPVKLGLRNEDEGLVEVKVGLAKGAHILGAKLDGVKPGSTVKLADFSPSGDKKN
jgi:membrane fusion protein (multidrug efflux system)